MFDLHPDSCSAGEAIQYLPHYLQRGSSVARQPSSCRASISRWNWKTNLVNSSLMRAVVPTAARRDLMWFWRRLGRKRFGPGCCSQAAMSGRVSFQRKAKLSNRRSEAVSSRVDLHRGPPDQAQTSTKHGRPASSISTRSAAYNYTFPFFFAAYSN